jgi:hypothetical protein
MDPLDQVDLNGFRNGEKADPGGSHQIPRFSEIQWGSLRS